MFLFNFYFFRNFLCCRFVFSKCDSKLNMFARFLKRYAGLLLNFFSQVISLVFLSGSL